MSDRVTFTELPCAPLRTYSLLRVADKYDFQTVKYIVSVPLFALAPNKTVDVLRLALRYRQTELVQHALRHMGWNRLSSLGSEVLANLPPAGLLRLIKIQEEVGSGKDWANYADQFVSRLMIIPRVMVMSFHCPRLILHWFRLVVRASMGGSHSPPPKLHTDLD